MSRWARKTDATHELVVDAFRAAGWTVMQTFRLGSDAPDLVVSRQGRVIAVEVKAAKGKLRPGQAEWLARWQGETAICRSMEDVMMLSEARNG